MPDVRVERQPKETTVFETKIEKLRQLSQWSRTLFLLDIFAIVVLAVAIGLAPSKLPVKSIDLTWGVPIFFFYAGYVVFDFLADLGLIVLSMKKESQYVTKVVQQVQEGRR
jgi:hypothetical protein